MNTLVLLSVKIFSAGADALQALYSFRRRVLVTGLITVVRVRAIVVQCRVQVTPAQLGLEVVPFRASTSFLDTGGIGERRGTLHVLGARFQDFSSGWETSVLPCRDHGFRGTIARVFLVAHSTVHVRAFLGLRAATAKINSFVAGSFHVVIAAYTVAHAILARSVRQISQALVVIDAREVDSFGLFQTGLFVARQHVILLAGALAYRRVANRIVHLAVLIELADPKNGRLRVSADVLCNFRAGTVSNFRAVLAFAEVVHAAHFNVQCIREDRAILKNSAWNRWIDCLRNCTMEGRR